MENQKAIPTMPTVSLTFNRVTEKTVPNFGKSIFEYDIISGIDNGCWAETTTDPKGNTTTKVYDKVGRLSQVMADGKTTTYAYYDNGSRKNVLYPDGSKEEYTYYADNFNKTLVTTKADGTQIDSYSYTYDAAHNQTGKTDKKGVTSYTYDAAGNRTTETVTQNGSTTTTVYTYNEQNRLK